MTAIRAQVWTAGAGFSDVAFAPEDAGGWPLVAIDLASVCGSDAHTVLGRRASPSPSILGHEAVGRVVALGDAPRRDVAGRPLAVGDRVVWSVTASCGACDRCAAGLTAKCRHVLKVGHEATTSGWPLSGGYATHLALHPGLAVVRVPDGVADGPAAMASCALATVMACLEAAGDLAGRRVLVLGAGMLGICAVAVAAERGASEVVVLEPDADRRRLARRYGATSVVDEVAGLVDVAVELTGSPSAVAVALGCVDVGGVTVLAGSVTPAGTVALDPEKVVRGWQTIRGVHNYEPRHLAQAIEFLAQGSVDFRPLLAEPVPLADLSSLFGPPSPGVLRRTVVP